MDEQGAIRTVERRGGGCLLIRPTDPRDLPALTAFYEALPEDDRRCRFFSAHVPAARFFERWVRLREQGGLGLVVLERDADGHELIVGETGYSLQPDGGGEFAIAVARSHRGWLGPYLLDTLVEAAAERGVPYLAADILLTNQRMLAVVRHRGYASIGHDEWHTVRVLIGTHSRVPEWPGDHDRPRVLVEAAGARWHAEKTARDAELSVIVCPGPGSTGGRRCPAVQGRPCPLATGADGIVVSLRPDDPYATTMLETHARLHPGTPVYAEASGTSTEESVGQVRTLLGGVLPADAQAAR